MFIGGLVVIIIIDIFFRSNYDYYAIIEPQTVIE